MLYKPVTACKQQTEIGSEEILVTSCFLYHRAEVGTNVSSSLRGVPVILTAAVPSSPNARESLMKGEVGGGPFRTL